MYIYIMSDSCLILRSAIGGRHRQTKRQKRISLFGDIDDVFSLRGQGIGTGGTQSIT